MAAKVGGRARSVNDAASGGRKEEGGMRKSEERALRGAHPAFLFLLPLSSLLLATFREPTIEIKSDEAKQALPKHAASGTD
jgi:hypothetical protein